MVDHYANYAQHYDQGTTTNLAKKVDLIKQVIRKKNPAAKYLLEVACGTGNVLVHMQPEYTVTGLDLSPKMLDIAKHKLPNVKFYESDMTSFKIGERFDTIICVFDSVNHLLSFRDWESLFDRVKEHLDDNGVFIMDVNTIAKLDKFSTFPAFRLDFDEGYQMAKIVKTDNGIYHWKLDIHSVLEDGTEKIIKNDIPEVAFPLQKIEDALRKRYKVVDRFTSDGKVADESQDRIYFASSI